MPQQLTAQHAALATGHPLGAAAGLDILRDGGNAIDAAVASTLALCVVIPGMVGLGGYGGSAVIYLARERRVVSVDFDSRCPLAFREGVVTADPRSNYYGARAVTVPAVVAGLALTLEEFGTKSWREVSLPAIRLAREGFPVDAEHKKHFDRCARRFDSQSLHALFPGGTLPEIGATWRQPDLAKLLERLSVEGPQSFYQGDIADKVVGFICERDGILSEEDFRSYRPTIEKAISATFRTCELFTPPPPSGGVTSLAIMQTMEQLVEREHVSRLDAGFFHGFAEASQLCWQERQQGLGDPDFVAAPIARMLSREQAERRANEIRGGESVRNHASADRSAHTSNVIAADAEGNLISLTATQGWMYGAHLVVDGLGLALNHGMSRFDYKPGHPNGPAPGKRMQHNMSPLVGMCDGKPSLAIGLPGGPKIVTATAQVALDVLAFSATPAEAVAAPRLHTDGAEPLAVSTHMSDAAIAELTALGHHVRREPEMGGPLNVLTIDSHTNAIDVASGESTGAVAGF
jgi:gamma-glutamyltranspeptidase/glutathione hydrolase